MYLIKVKGSFDAAHRLDKYQGKCQNLHGHTWVFELALVYIGPLDDVGISVDFCVAKRWTKEIEELFDHKYLNDTVEKPTAETLAEMIFENIKNKCHAFIESLSESKKACRELTISHVTLWETPDNCIQYMED